jgi:SAM-dependent methyltransferase
MTTNESALDQAYLAAIGMTGKDYKQVMLDCEICGRRDFEPVLNKGKIGRAGEYGPINITQCRHCGHVMMNPRFEKQFYVDYYREHYKDNVAFHSGSAPPPDLVERQILRGDKCRLHLAESHGIDGTDMLDLGCGSGATMIPFRNAGWTVSGIDPDMEAVTYGTDTLKVPVVYGFAEELPYGDASMDLVISLGALEHVHDFAASMSELNRVIRPGGHLFIRMRHNRPWGVMWEYYNRNHYRFFCDETHTLAVMRWGFDVVELTDKQIEGRSGDRYLICRRVADPSIERVEAAIAKGVKDSPAKLKGYLREHHARTVDRCRNLLALEERCGGDLGKMAEEITSGRFPMTLLYGYSDPAQAVERALLEARRYVRESGDDGLCD